MHEIRQLSCYKPEDFVHGTNYVIHFPITYLKMKVYLNDPYRGEMISAIHTQIFALL